MRLIMDVPLPRASSKALISCNIGRSIMHLLWPEAGRQLSRRSAFTRTLLIFHISTCDSPLSWPLSPMSVVTTAERERERSLKLSLASFNKLDWDDWR